MSLIIFNRTPKLIIFLSIEKLNGLLLKNWPTLHDFEKKYSDKLPLIQRLSSRVQSSSDCQDQERIARARAANMENSSDLLFHRWPEGISYH